MKLNGIKYIKMTLALALLCGIFSAFKPEKDALHKRIFNIFLDEVRDGIPTKKGISDKLYFKDGKVYSDYLGEKYGFKWIRYRINVDTMYVDSTDTEVRQLDVEASATDETNQTVIINFTTVEWDMEGTVKITKNDKVKKYYDMVGREKGGKPKKPKKKKDKKLIEVVSPGQEATPMYSTTISPPKEKKE